MRALHIAIALVLGFGSTARAEGPLAVRAGVAVTVDLSSDSFDESTTRIGPALEADIGYRVIDALAAGIHVGITRNWESGSFVVPNPDVTLSYDNAYTSIQLGVGAQYSTGRAWIAPWIGVDDRDLNSNTFVQTSTRQLAFGLSLGVDLYTHPSGNRLGVYGEVSRGHRSETNEFNDNVYESTDVYASVGFGYRYW